MMTDCPCTEDEVASGCLVHDARTKGPVSPDCRDGNHTKCNGDAWDLVLDTLLDCYCPCVHAGRCNMTVPEAPGLCVREPGHGGTCNYPLYVRVTP